MSFPGKMLPLKDLDPGTYLRRAKSATFAEKISYIEIAANEVAEISRFFPLCFKLIDNKLSLCALLGFMPDQNLFVGSTGDWASPYVPNAIKAWPFGIIDHGSGNLELGVYENGICGSHLDDEERFLIFKENGEPSEEFRQVNEKLIAPTLKMLSPTRNVVKDLNDAGVISKWTVILELDGVRKEIENLFKVNENSIQNLDGKILKDLSKKGALGVAYAQILSEKRLDDLKTNFVNLSKAVDKRRILKDQENNEPKIKFDF